MNWRHFLGPVFKKSSRVYYLLKKRVINKASARGKRGPVVPPLGNFIFTHGDTFDIIMGVEFGS